MTKICLLLLPDGLPYVSPEQLTRALPGLNAGAALVAQFFPEVGLPPEVVLVSSLSEVGPSDRLFKLTRNIDDPDALAYHSLDQFNRVFAVCGLDVCSTQPGFSITEGPAALTCTLSHEIFEEMLDPNCDRYESDTQGRKYAYEICDPVQDTAFDLEGASLSNFVLPGWFFPGVGRKDYLGELSLQGVFSKTSGGYFERDGQPVGARQYWRQHTIRHARRGCILTPWEVSSRLTRLEKIMSQLSDKEAVLSAALGAMQARVNTDLQTLRTNLQTLQANNQAPTQAELDAVDALTASVNSFDAATGVTTDQPNAAPGAGVIPPVVGTPAPAARRR